jgi:hypothetical protein
MDGFPAVLNGWRHRDQASKKQAQQKIAFIASEL